MARARDIVADEIQMFAESQEPEKTETPDFSEIGTRSNDLEMSSNGKVEDPSEITLNTLRKMRQDAQVKACLLVLKLPILQLERSIHAETDEGKTIARWVEAQMDNMDDSMMYYTREMLTALDFGRSITEKVWKLAPTMIDPDDDNSRIEDRIIPYKLKTYDPRNLTIKLDPDTLKLEGVYQTTMRGERFIPADKLMIYSHDKEFGNYYGESVLRAAYKPWIIKEFLQKFWNIALERYGTPLQSMKMPQGGEIKKAIALMDMVKSKSGIPLPEGYELNIHDLANTGMSFKEAIEYQDKQIARAMLVPDTTFANSDTGSYSLSKTHAGFFEMRLNGIAQEIADIRSKYFIKPLVRYNYGEVSEFPVEQCAQVGDEDIEKLGSVVEKMINGSVIHPSEDWIRERLGMPPADEDSKEYLESKWEAGSSAVDNLTNSNNGDNQNNDPKQLDNDPKPKDDVVKNQELTDEELADYYHTNLRSSVRGLLKLGIGEE